MKAVNTIALVLLIVGGLNWGVLALTGWEIGQLFGGMDAMISKVVYVLVGLSALLIAARFSKMSQACE